MDIFFLCVMFLTLKFVPNSEECHLPHFQGELCNCRHYLLTIFSFSYNVKTVMLLLALSWGALFPCLLKLQRILDKKKINTKIFINLSFHVPLSFLEFLSRERRGREGGREGGEREGTWVKLYVTRQEQKMAHLLSEGDLGHFSSVINLETTKSSEGHMLMVFEPNDRWIICLFSLSTTYLQWPVLRTGMERRETGCSIVGFYHCMFSSNLLLVPDFPGPHTRFSKPVWGHNSEFEKLVSKFSFHFLLHL